MEINIERPPQHWCPNEGSNSQLLITRTMATAPLKYSVCVSFPRSWLMKALALHMYLMRIIWMHEHTFEKKQTKNALRFFKFCFAQRYLVCARKSLFLNFLGVWMGGIIKELRRLWPRGKWIFFLDMFLKMNFLQIAITSHNILKRNLNPNISRNKKIC